MSDEHVHLMRYTLCLEPGRWWQRLWGGCSTKVIYGTRSSVQGNELLIFAEHGTFYSINYGRVRWMTAEPANDNERGKV